MNRYKINNNIIVITVAIFLLVVSSLIYNLYFKDYLEHNKFEDKKDSLYVNITDEKTINELLNVIKVNNLKDIAAFEKNIDNINTLEPIEKINIAFNALNTNKKEIDVIEVDNYFKNSFKTTIYWDKEDIYCVNGEVLYKYDILNNKYIYNDLHNCENHYDINPVYTKVLNAKKKNDTYVITVSFIWNNDVNKDILFSSYKNAINKDNELLVVSSEDDKLTNDINRFIESNYDNIKEKLRKYKFIFEKIENRYLLVNFNYSE